MTAPQREALDRGGLAAEGVRLGPDSVFDAVRAAAGDRVDTRLAAIAAKMAPGAARERLSAAIRDGRIADAMRLVVARKVFLDHRAEYRDDLENGWRRGWAGRSWRRGTDGGAPVADAGRALGESGRLAPRLIAEAVGLKVTVIGPAQTQTYGQPGHPGVSVVPVRDIEDVTGLGTGLPGQYLAAVPGAAAAVA